MDAELVDPRSGGSLDEFPKYRVHYWNDEGTTSEEWRLSGVTDVHEALAWASENARLRRYVLYVETSHPAGLLRLLGGDPTESA